MQESQPGPSVLGMPRWKMRRQYIQEAQDAVLNSDEYKAAIAAGTDEVMPMPDGC